jgi:hypothetical protein
LRRNKSTLLKTIKRSLIFYTLHNQIHYAHTKDEGRFINARQINLFFKGAKPIYTGDFNELVDKQYLIANFITRQFFTRLLALKQDRNFGSNLLANLPHQLPRPKTKRSPATKKNLCDLNTVFSIFNPAKIKINYTTSIGNKCWRQSQTPDEQTIQELLLKDIQIQQDKNHILGKKIDHIVNKVEALKQQASTTYDLPSVRLSQSPIMNILSKTVATYMFLRQLNNPREENEL